MPYTVYFSDTSSELQDLRPVIVERIQAAGLIPVWLDETERQSPDMPEHLRRKIQAATAFISLVTYRRAWETAGGRALTEVEYELAREYGKPLAVLLPRPGSEMAMYLRRRAFNQSGEQRAAQEAFWRRLLDDGTATYFDDETDLLLKLGRILESWAEVGPVVPQFAPQTALAPAAELAPPPPTAPGQARESARGLALGEPEIETLAERIAAKTAARLDDLQARRQADLAEQAVKVNDALRVWPGELVFGRPSKGRQFQSDIFVIMPFAAQFTGLYTGIIKPLAAELGLTVLRGDELSSSRGSIMEEVWAALNACRFVIAEITGGNDNVFYELGIAHTLNKPTLLITQAAAPENVPFDIRHLRYIVYSAQDGAKLRDALRTAITRLLAELSDGGM
ncbi:MAG: DUF4062 domain-containing protein [Chloroflexi bacterium]|nr:DUF4062 domain-containing protein [Chloroflexota bacterium]